jgi:hypothetical protein
LTCAAGQLAGKMIEGERIWEIVRALSWPIMGGKFISKKITPREKRSH